MRRNTVLILALLLTLAVPAYAQDANGIELDARGSPLVSANDGAEITVEVRLDAPGELRLRIADFDGRTVRELYDGPREAGTLTRSWRGRDRSGDRVANGPYRVVAMVTRDGATDRATEWVAVADRKIYPRRPGFITVAVDPGHGGRLDGAVAPDGTREADLNLDIAMRVARMLEAAKVNVVITRTSDEFVNTPEIDRTGDGVIDETDELAARTDTANEARADVFISVHNNIAVNESVGGPSTFYFDTRPFGARSERLAEIIQGEMVAALAGASAGTWEPYDHGALIYPYYVLRGFDPPRLRRPTQMPGVLSEGMFLSNPRELRLLKRPAVRQAMAVAYYDAIATYLARRLSHAGYELLTGPTVPVEAGATVDYEIEIRNHGNEAMRGWDIVVGAVPERDRYEGRGRDGRPVGSGTVHRIEPGEKAVVGVEVTAPDTGGEWTLLFDARDRDDRRASKVGSPRLQVPLTTLPPPDPSPLPSTSPQPSPSEG